MLLPSVLPVVLAAFAGAARADAVDRTLEAFEAPAVVTVEHYLLTGPAPDARRGVDAAAEDEDPRVAVVALRRIERVGTVLLEREITFREHGLRVRHTETLRRDWRRLVWRELLPTRARTWVAEWSTDGGPVTTLAYGWRRPVHESITTGRTNRSPLVGPLELLDRLRDGDKPGDDRSIRNRTIEASARIVDPSAACIDAVRIEHDAERVVVRRDDRSLVLDAVLGADRDLAGSRWAEGEARLEPLDRAEYERLRRRWIVPMQRSHEAALARVPTRR